MLCKKGKLKDVLEKQLKKFPQKNPWATENKKEDVKAQALYGMETVEDPEDSDKVLS